MNEIGVRRTLYLDPVSVANPWPVTIEKPAPSIPIPATSRSSFSVAAVSGDAVVIFGREGVLIKVTEIAIAKPSTQETILIIKRSTADTGGTSTVQTNIAMDSSDPLSGTVVRAYTAAPTTGTSLGNIARCVVAVGDVLILSFGGKGKCPTLRNNSECLAINVDATGTLAGWLEWVEEAGQ